MRETNLAAYGREAVWVHDHCDKLAPRLWSLPHLPASLGIDPSAKLESIKTP